MATNKIFWECPACGYGSITDELITDQGERFINCIRCGDFSQVMVKSAIKNLDELRKLYPKYIETETHITIQSGGWGTWTIIQKESTHEGSFINKNHINDFIKQLDEFLAVENVVEVRYHIKNDDGEWKEIIRKK